MTKRWHKDVDTVCKRLCLAFILSHTLCTGILYRGSAGYTRAQTAMVLINGFAFELIMLCLTYSPPAEGPYTINIVGIIISATICGLIVVPAMVSFAWVFHPITFIRFGAWLVRAFFCWPLWIFRALCAKTRVAPGGSSEEAGKNDDDGRDAHPARRAVRYGGGSGYFRDDTSAVVAASQRSTSGMQQTLSYKSLQEGMLKASITYTYERKDWPAFRLVLLGWVTSWVLFLAMLYTFLLYGCHLFEPRERPNDRPAGQTDELIVAWSLSALQRFVFHEPTLILASKGLPILFASAFCMNCCGEAIVNLLTVAFEVIMTCVSKIARP